MDHNPCLYAQKILTGVVEVEGGSIREARAGEGGKESAISAVEALDEVCSPPPQLCTRR